MLRCLYVLGLLCAASVATAAEDLEFRAPAAADGAATAASMRSLAVRALPVYQNPNRAQFLTNLSALQMVAGEYQAADATRRSLEEVRAGAKRVAPRIDMALVYDIYASARAAAAKGHIPFDRAFARVFRETVTPLSDRDAYTLEQWLTTPLSVFRENLQSALDRLRGRERLSLSQAVDLAWTYLSFEAFQSFSPLLGPLVAEDDSRRYIIDSSVRVQTSDHAEISALVVRPKSVPTPLPTLLEFRMSADPRDGAKECAAHGYIGVIAYARAAGLGGETSTPSTSTREGSEAPAPYEHDGDDARSVIEWIGGQPWSDGRVAMYGTGYSAFAAWAAAKRPPAALKALAVASAPVPGLSATFAASANVPSAIERRWLKHPSFDRYWQRMVPYGKDFALIDMPVLTITGYYDEREPESLYYFTQHYRYNPHANQILLIGPYDALAMQRGALPVLAGYPIDSAALIDLHELRFSWFDEVLKAGPAPELLRERVNFEVMGANEWRHAESVRAMSNRAARLYLDSSRVQGEYRLAGHEPSRRRFIEQKVEPGLEAAAGAAPAILGRVLAPRNAVVFLSGPLHRPLQVSGLVSGQLAFVARRSPLELRIALYELMPSGDYLELFAPPDELCASPPGEARRPVAYRSDRLTSVELQTGSRLVMVLGADAPSPDHPGSCADRSLPKPPKGRPVAPFDVRWYAASFIEIPVSR
jgi:uncharacterized protein